MNKPDPIRGDRSDDPTGLRDLWQDRPAGHLDGVIVRTGSSNADAIQFCPRSRCSTSPISSSASSSRSQSDRGLDSAERSAVAEPEARGSGKSGGKRRDRRETSGGSGAVPSAGWREVAEWCHAEGGVGHE